MLDKEKLAAIVNQSETSKNIFYVLGLRRRTRHTTHLGRFKLALVHQFGKVVESDFRETFKELEQLGIGKTVNNKFLWNYDLIKVARFAMNSGEEPKVVNDRRRMRVVRPRPTQAQAQATTVTVKPAPMQEPTTVAGLRVDIKKGDTTISTTLNAEQLMEVLKKIG